MFVTKKALKKVDDDSVERDIFLAENGLLTAKNMSKVINKLKAIEKYLNIEYSEKIIPGKIIPVRVERGYRKIRKGRNKTKFALSFKE